VQLAEPRQDVIPLGLEVFLERNLWQVHLVSWVAEEGPQGRVLSPAQPGMVPEVR
jgi:hypothetical protein